MFDIQWRERLPATVPCKAAPHIFLPSVVGEGVGEKDGANFCFKIDPNFIKNLSKMLPKCSQNGPKWGPDGLWSPLWGLRRVRNRFWSKNGSSFGTKIGPKLVKNQPKIEKIPIPKPTFNSITIFDQILINFEAKIESNFDQILR